MHKISALAKWGHKPRSCQLADEQQPEATTASTANRQYALRGRGMTVVVQ